MQLFLHVLLDDKSEPAAFQTSLGAWIKRELPNVVYFNVDQHSEDLVMRTAVEAIERSKGVFTFIDGKTTNPQSIFKIIKKLQKYSGSGSIRIVNNCDNPLFAKLSKAFGSNWQSQLSDKELKKEVITFFKPE